MGEGGSGGGWKVGEMGETEAQDLVKGTRKADGEELPQDPQGFSDKATSGHTASPLTKRSIRFPLCSEPLSGAQVGFQPFAYLFNS